MTFKVGDRVLTEYDNKHGVLCEVISTEAGRYDYLVRPLADQPVDHLPMSVQRYEDELTEIHEPTAPTPFRKGDRVEHTDNAPGFIMTVAADQYTSGAVEVTHPDGSRHDYQARFLKRAEPDAPIDKTESICGGNNRSTKTRAKTLREAGKLIDGDRANDYDTKDDATGNFNRIAQLWSPILGTAVTATQVALCLTQLKVARLIVNPTKQDSWIDAAGYVALGSEIAEQENK